VSAPSPETRAAIGARVAACPRVSTAWLFGSVARGDATPESDLDVAVLLAGRPRGRDDDELRELAIELEMFSPSGRVDIVVLGAQGSVFRHRVLTEGVLVLDRDRDARVEFETRTVIEYLDWKPTHDIAMASTFAGLRHRLAGTR
jgi:predicted nucleotidyltransferase